MIEEYNYRKNGIEMTLEERAAYNLLLNEALTYEKVPAPPDPLLDECFSYCLEQSHA